MPKPCQSADVICPWYRLLSQERIYRSVIQRTPCPLTSLQSPDRPDELARDMFSFHHLLSYIAIARDILASPDMFVNRGRALSLSGCAVRDGAVFGRHARSQDDKLGGRKRG